MRIGILGGTFNPPHNGHIWAAKIATERLGFSKVIFVPTGNPPHKKIPEDTATTEQRLEMTKIAAKENSRFEVSDMEIKRGGESYTLLTITELAKEYPEDELYFIVGTDMLLSFEKWYKPEEILKKCSLVVVPRRREHYNKLKEKARKLSLKFNAEIIVLDCEAVTVSSTELRENELYDIPKTVCEYIKANGLYEKT